MGKSTISMAIFNSYMLNYQRVHKPAQIDVFFFTSLLTHDGPRILVPGLL